MTVTILEPGAETSEQYHRSGAWGSTLISHFQRSPKLAHLIRTGAWLPEPTPAMKFGQAFHNFMDPGGHFDANYRIGPDVHHNTKEWKEAVKGAKVDGVGLLSPKDRTALTAMRASVLANPIAASLVEGAQHEVGFRMQSPYGENLLQCRADLLHRWSHLADFKTTDDLDDFRKSIQTYGYHRQAALYQWIAHASCGKWLPFSFIVVEKERPLYRCRVFDLTQEYVDIGWREIEPALIEIGARTKVNDWADHRDADMLAPQHRPSAQARSDAA